MKYVLLAAALVSLLCSCDVRPSTPARSTTNNSIASLQYGQDRRTELCYAVVESKGIIDVHAKSMTITWVPCEPKVLALINE